MRAAAILLAYAGVLCAGAASRAQEAGESPFVRGPYLQAVLDTSAEVVWFSRVKAAGKVVYTAEGGKRVEVAESEPGLVHRIRLTDLSPGSVYPYDVFQDDENLTEGLGYRIRTAPPAGEGVVRVVSFGDSGSGLESQSIIAGLVCELNPELIVHTGDLVYIGSVDEAVFKPYKDIFPSVCFYPAKGNHDIAFGTSPLMPPWRDVFFPPNENPEETGTYYSFDWGPAHFLVLDSVPMTSFMVDFTTQIEWAADDLAAARARGQRWLIVAFHHPPYTVGRHAFSHPMLRSDVTPLLDAFEVDLVLNGHDHNYQRSHPVRDGVVHGAYQDPVFIRPKGTTYVVTGGGGQFLYSKFAVADHSWTREFELAFHVVELTITPDELVGVALLPDRSEIDRFVLRKTGEIEPPVFLRGDTNLDGGVDIADPIKTLGYLFGGGVAECPAAGDANGSGLPLNIADPIYTLNHLFNGGPPPEAPYPTCGTAPDFEDDFCVRVECGD